MASARARDTLSSHVLLFVMLFGTLGCELKIDGEPSPPKGDTGTAPAVAEPPPAEGTCTVHPGDLPVDLQSVRAFLGSEFEFEALPDDFAGCLIEPTGHHTSYVCADRQAVVANNEPAEHFALIIEVEQRVESIIASTDASAAELREVLSCCERRETRARFFAGDLDEFYVCGTMDVAFGTPSRQMFSGDKLAVVMRRTGFDLDAAVSNELGGEDVGVEGLSYRLDNKELTESVPLLSGEALEAREGEEFLTVYYTLRNTRPQRETVTHDRIEVLDGGGKVFEPIPAARDSRTAMSNGEHNGMLMLVEIDESRQLKDVFAIPKGMAREGFGVRFHGLTDQFEDRYVLGERRWLSRPQTANSTTERGSGGGSGGGSSPDSAVGESEDEAAESNE